MQLVSPQFQPAIESPKRQVKARVHLDLVGNFVDKGASVAASSSQNAVAMPPAQAINSRTAPRRKWAAANFLTLDGTYHPIPADGKEETGWWGGKRSSEVGALKQDAAAPTFSRPSPAYLSDGTLVASGQPRFETGKFGQAITVEEPSSNQIENSSAVVPNGSVPANWIPFVVSGAATATWENGGFQGKCLKVSAPTTADRALWEMDYILSAKANQVYTLSGWLDRVDLNPGHLQIQETCTGPTYIVHGAAYTGRSKVDTSGKTWYEVAVTFTTSTAFTGWSWGVRIDTITNNATNRAVTYQACDIQLEEKSYATSYIRNDSLSAAATRAAEALTVPTAGVLSPTAGTVEFAVHVDGAVHIAGTSWMMAFVVTDSNENNQIRFGKYSGSADWHVKFQDAGGGVWLQTFPVSPGWRRIAITWNAASTTAKVFVDGALVASNTAAPLPGSFANTDGGIRIGHWLQNSYQLNSLLDDLRLSSIARSDAEILSEVQSNAPLPVDEWTTYKLRLDDTLNAEQATNETLTITFPARKVKTFWWHGDAIRGWYPTDFKVEYYDTQAAAWVLVADVTGWASPYWETSLAAITAKVVTQIRLTITKVAPAGSCACILEFDATVTETYEGDDLLSLSLLEEMEADTGTLAIGNISSNEVDLRLNNIDRRFNPGNTASPYYGLLKPNRRIRPYLGVVLADGTTEYVPLGVFWSGDWDARADSLEATTSGQDLLKFMAESTFSTSQVYVNKTLYDLAVIVLQDYGLQDTDYEIDADLKNYVIPYAWFDKTSHRAALQRIAEAGLAAVFMARDGLLKIKSYRFLAGATSLGQVSDQVHIMSSNNPQRNSQVVNTVEVEANPLKADVSKVIYQTTEAVTVPAGGTKSLTVFFTEKPVINVGAPALSGATNTVVQSWSAYAWGGDLVLSNPGGAAENVSLTVSGQPLVEAGRILAKAQDATRVAEEGVIKKSVSNDLIQTTALAQSIADAILAVWSNAAKDVVSQVRGDPSWELGDRRTWADDRANVTGDHVIIRQRLEYDGGLAGEVTGRRV